MKIRIIFIGLIVTFLITFINGQECCDTNSIQVKGLGLNRVKSDIAKIFTHLSANDITTQKALSKMNEKLNKVKQSLFYFINDYDFQTSLVGVYSNYNYTNNKTQKTGYTVYIYLTIIIRDIEFNTNKIASIIDILINNDVSFISKTLFETQDSSGGKDTAKANVLTDAWNDALTKANQYANIIGKRLGKILSMQQILMTDYPQNEYGGKYTQADYSNTEQPNLYGQTPIIPIGTVPLAAQVTVTWEIVE